MDESTTREKVLKKIRAALLNKTADPFPHLDHESAVYHQSDDDPVVIFADHFIQAGGKFILCENELEFVEGLISLAEQFRWTSIYCGEEGLSNLLTECEFPHDFEPDLNKMDVAVTSCECLVARNGTVVVSSLLNGIATPAFAPVHIVCARSSQIAMEIKDAIHWLKQQYNPLPSAISFITGPARTQQLEGTFLPHGHGASQLYVFLIDDKDRGYIDAAPDVEEEE